MSSPAGLVELLDLLFGFAHRRQVLVDLDPVGAAHLAAQIVRLGQHVVEDAPLQLARLAAEEAVEGQRRIQLDRDRRIRRAPRDVRRIDHRILALVEAADRLLAAEHQAGHRRFFLEMLRQLLVHADAAVDHPAAQEVGPGKDVAGAAGVAAVAVPVEQAVDDVELFLVGRQRLQARAQFHRRAVALRPPVRRRDAVADEQAGEPLRRLGWPAGGGIAGEELRGFQPGQGDGTAQTLEQHSTGNLVRMVHGFSPGGSVFDRAGVKSLPR